MSRNPTKPGQTPPQKKRPPQKSGTHRRHHDEPQIMLQKDAAQDADHVRFMTAMR